MYMRVSNIGDIAVMNMSVIFLLLSAGIAAGHLVTYLFIVNRNVVVVTMPVIVPVSMPMMMVSASRVHPPEIDSQTYA
jgi:hypothetical protein